MPLEIIARSDACRGWKFINVSSYNNFKLATVSANDDDDDDYDNNNYNSQFGTQVKLLMVHVIVNGRVISTFPPYFV